MRKKKHKIFTETPHQKGLTEIMKYTIVVKMNPIHGLFWGSEYRLFYNSPTGTSLTHMLTDPLHYC
jgi:hypothetical protein